MDLEPEPEISKMGGSGNPAVRLPFCKIVARVRGIKNVKPASGPFFRPKATAYVITLFT